MAGITLAQAEARLTLYLQAEEAVLAKQSYEIDTGSGRRKLTLADLAEIQAGIATWDQRAKALSAATTAGGGGRLRTIVPSR
jgi:hypothetical protein